MLETSHLEQILRQASRARLKAFTPALVAAMRQFDIDRSLRRSAAFIAQLAHESGEFHFMEEIWGPTAAQKRYEPPSDLARRLGNTQPGRWQALQGPRPDPADRPRQLPEVRRSCSASTCVGEPDLAATPEVGFQVAGPVLEAQGPQRTRRRGQLHRDHAPHQRRPERRRRARALLRAGHAGAGARLPRRGRPARPARRPAAKAQAAGAAAPRPADELARRRSDPARGRHRPAGVPPPPDTRRRPAGHARLPRPHVHALADRGADAHPAGRLPGRTACRSSTRARRAHAPASAWRPSANYLLLRRRVDSRQGAGEPAHAVRPRAPL